MIVFKTVSDIMDYLSKKSKSGISVGFVPTMGALHKGHISLITRSKATDDITVCSIFINPTQFNDQQDFDLYPVTIENDIDMLEKGGCDVLFLPGVKDIYPNGTKNEPHYELGYLEKILEGEFRPGHYQGVCQVVNRLLSIVRPDRLYLGQKDYQQCMVLTRLVEMTHFETGIIIVPTCRESDGLAMSSRNIRLTDDDRKRAVKLSETLFFIKKEIKPGYLEDIKERGKKYLVAEGFNVDYLEIANASTLEPVENWDGKTPLVALVAAFVNDVRLIDNVLLQD